MRFLALIALVACEGSTGHVIGWTPLAADEHLVLDSHTTLTSQDSGQTVHEDELAVRVHAFDVVDGEARRLRLEVQRDVVNWAGYPSRAIDGVFEAQRETRGGPYLITKGGVRADANARSRLDPALAVLTHGLAVQRKLLTHRFRVGERYELAPAERTAFGVGSYSEAVFVFAAVEGARFDFAVHLARPQDKLRPVGHAQITRGGGRLDLVVDAFVDAGSNTTTHATYSIHRRP